MSCAIAFSDATQVRDHKCEYLCNNGKLESESIPNEAFICQICPKNFEMKFKSVESLQSHYTVAHYQSFFVNSSKGTLPKKCDKKTCNEQLESARYKWNSDFPYFFPRIISFI